MNTKFLEKYTIHFPQKKGPTLYEVVSKRMKKIKSKGGKIHAAERVDEILYGK